MHPHDASGPHDSLTAWADADTRAAYDEVADTYADHFTSTQPEDPLDLAMIDHFATSVPGSKRVLDAGCGAGRMMPYLAARGCLVEGVDLPPEMIHRARRDHPDHPVRVGSLNALPFADASFDGYVSWYSTIHTADSDLPIIATEARRVLRPGGVLLVAFQTGSGARDVADGCRRRGHDIVLMRYGRAVSTMVETLAAAGFSVSARMDRVAVGSERDGQAVVIAR